jgi:hypothetical protein
MNGHTLVRVQGWMSGRSVSVAKSAQGHGARSPGAHRPQLTTRATSLQLEGDGARTGHHHVGRGLQWRFGRSGPEYPGQIVGVLSSLVGDVREVGIVTLPASLPDYDSISTMIDDPTRAVVSAALGAGADH